MTLPCSSPAPPLHLPASTELVLEIQLNKLINEFLFSGQGTPSPPTNAACASKISTPETGSAACSTAITGAVSPENQKSTSQPPPQAQIWAMPHASSQGDVTLTVLDSVTGDSPPASAPRLCKSYSEVGSLFCFAMESSCVAEKGEQNQNQKQKQGSSIKFSRFSSLPCKGSEERSCRKPPRPPRSSLSSEDAILILRSPSAASSSSSSATCRRSISEKRRKGSSSGSSAASTWALVFTFLFATAIIGEDLWSHKSRISEAAAAMEEVKAMEDKDNSIEAHHMMMNPDLSSSSSPLHSQAIQNLRTFTMRKQITEFWVSKQQQEQELDPLLHQRA